MARKRQLRDQRAGTVINVTSKKQVSCPILIAEVKNQGTNDLRAKEGLPKQAKGNAIERLGKDLIGLRTALMRESIFPFVCFLAMAATSKPTRQFSTVCPQWRCSGN